MAGLEPNSSIRKIIFNPNDSETIYICDLLSGVYLSEDGGAKWFKINENLFNRSVTDLSISADGQHLYASTSGNGVYRADLNGEPPISTTVNSEMDISANMMETRIYPNPADHEFAIEYSLDDRSIIKINIYDLNGRLINTLLNRMQDSGKHMIFWNLEDSQKNKVTSGIYFCQFEFSNKIAIQKMIVLE